MSKRSLRIKQTFMGHFCGNLKPIQASIDLDTQENIHWETLFHCPFVLEAHQHRSKPPRQDASERHSCVTPNNNKDEETTSSEKQRGKNQTEAIDESIESRAHATTKKSKGHTWWDNLNWTKIRKTSNEANTIETNENKNNKYHCFWKSRNLL